MIRHDPPFPILPGDDLEQARHEFLAADGIKDGPLLLALTYDAGVVAPANSAALHTAEPLPGALEKRLEADTERQPSPAGVAYFMTQLRRMQPETSLIPGEWLELMPPRISVERAIVSASGR